MNTVAVVSFVRDEWPLLVVGFLLVALLTTIALAQRTDPRRRSSPVDPREPETSVAQDPSEPGPPARDEETGT